MNPFVNKEVYFAKGNVTAFPFFLNQKAPYRQ